MECDPQLVNEASEALNCLTKPQTSHLWDIAKLFVAFLLTSVFGAALTSWFQNRNWQHQRKVQHAERYDDKATLVFEDISSILDQRLFRYRQIVYAFRTGNEDRIETAFAEYREVLFKWNDQINRNYALVEKFFGKEMRRKLEHDIMNDMRFIGTLLEREKKHAENKIGVEEVWKKIDCINAKVYDFDMAMLNMISNRTKDII